MIQRIQSLFLLGAALVSAALFFLPLSEVPFTSPEGIKGVLTLSVMEITSSIDNPGQILAPKYFLLIINLLVMAATVYIIFLFKNRPAQIRLTAEPSERASRARALGDVRRQHAIRGYSGIRVDSQGRRFWIHNARVWTLWRQDASGHDRPCGQAAAFSDWHWLEGSAGHSQMET